MSSLVGEEITLSNVSERDCENSSTPVNIHLNKEGDSSDVKKTGRLVHFCDGTLEECDSNEDEKDGCENSSVDPSTLTWGPWIYCQAANAGTKTLQIVDYVGESLANFFGITTPKYQYEIDEYEIMCAEEEEEKKAEDLEMGGWTEGSSKPIANPPKTTYCTEVAYEGPIKLQPNTVQS